MRFHARVGDVELTWLASTKKRTTREIFGGAHVRREMRRLTKGGGSSEKGEDTSGVEGETRLRRPDVRSRLGAENTPMHGAGRLRAAQTLNPPRPRGPVPPPA